MSFGWLFIRFLYTPHKQIQRDQESQRKSSKVVHALRSHIAKAMVHLKSVKQRSRAQSPPIIHAQVLRAGKVQVKVKTAWEVNDDEASYEATEKFFRFGPPTQSCFLLGGADGLFLCLVAYELPRVLMVFPDIKSDFSKVFVLQLLTLAEPEWGN